MNEPQCKDCEHYLRHYVLARGKIFHIYCGHCTFPRAKRKNPDAKGCEYFTPGAGDTEAFASKEYLSKRLLEHMLSLELLPEIEEFPASKLLKISSATGSAPAGSGDIG